MSYYGDGRVSSDFVRPGPAAARQDDDPDVFQVYFTGCAGNVTAGKYNDGSKENRADPPRRVHDGIVAAEKRCGPSRWGRCAGRPTTSCRRADRADVEPRQLEARSATRRTPSSTATGRRSSSPGCGGSDRSARSCSVPARQRRDAAAPAGRVVRRVPARRRRSAPKRFVATAAYGDGGPWYIPTQEAYPDGGYEVSVAFCDPGSMRC